MKQKNFEVSLKEGIEAENEFAEELKRIGLQVKQMEGHHPEYDMEVTNPATGETKTYEVKYDKMRCETGNVPVEVGKIVKGVGLPSGLSITTADYHVYKFQSFPNWYIIETSKLKELVNEKNDSTKSPFQLQTGDGDRTTLDLVCAKKFETYCLQKFPRKEWLEEREAKRLSLQKVREELNIKK